jgi:hypothetical protein
LDKLVKGRWLIDTNGEVMFDPQTSGLINWRGQLLSISNRSAHPLQRMRFHPINKDNAQIQNMDMVIRVSEFVANGCFGAYLVNNPDLEALAVDPDDDKILYLVTEDASGNQLTECNCKRRLANSGSTGFPRLLLRLQLQKDNRVINRR